MNKLTLLQNLSEHICQVTNIYLWALNTLKDQVTIFKDSGIHNGRKNKKEWLSPRHRQKQNT